MVACEIFSTLVPVQDIPNPNSNPNTNPIPNPNPEHAWKIIRWRPQRIPKMRLKNPQSTVCETDYHEMFFNAEVLKLGCFHPPGGVRPGCGQPHLQKKYFFCLCKLQTPFLILGRVIMI